MRSQLAENAIRKDFLPSEIDAIRRALEPIERAAAERRMKAGTPAKVSQGAGRATDKILSNVDDPTASTPHNGAATLSPTSDPYLEIPAFLKRH
jgi:hypothetical protein